jgi:bacterioferritin-associated ferredoxin
MLKMSVEEIKKRRRVVCICCAIHLGKVIDAIDAGASTVEQVNAATGCGRGDCSGQRCKPAILNQLQVASVSGEPT